MNSKVDINNLSIDDVHALIQAEKNANQYFEIPRYHEPDSSNINFIFSHI